MLVLNASARGNKELAPPPPVCAKPLSYGRTGDREGPDICKEENTQLGFCNSCPQMEAVVKWTPYISLVWRAGGG